MNESITTRTEDQTAVMTLTADIVCAYVSNNSVRVSEVPAILAGVHAAIVGLGKTSAGAAPAAETLTPAQIKRSITPDALISFIDGKSYKTLKRHLTTHGLTLEQYRERYGLPRDYPATAASYSATRSALAKSLGLGRKREAPPKAATAAGTVVALPKAGGRKTAGAAPAKPAKAHASKPRTSKTGSTKAVAAE